MNNYILSPDNNKTFGKQDQIDCYMYLRNNTSINDFT